MEEPQRRLEDGKQVAPRRDSHLAVGRAELRLHPLDIPVAEVAPEKVIDDMGGLMEAGIPQGLVDLFSDARGPGEDPAVHQGQSAPRAVGSAGADFRRGQLLDRRASTLEFVEVDEQKPRGIPDFIGEGAVARYTL